MAGRHVALLRGINVGRAKRVAMADLRVLLEELGYGDVRTLLNSGNAVFTAPRGARGDHAPRIEKALAGRLGVSSRVTVLSGAQFLEVAARNPLADVASDPARHLVGFLRTSSAIERLAPLLKEQWGAERLALGPGVAYLWCADGILASRVLEAVVRAAGDGITTRNWTTVSKLAALVRIG